MVANIEDLIDRLQLISHDIEQFDIELSEYESKILELSNTSLVRIKPPYVIRARAKNKIPTKIPRMTGIYLNELRVVLDNLAFTLATRNGYSGSSSVYFPISKSEEVFQSDGRKKIRHLSKADQQKIESIKPWKSERKNLYELHQLDIRRKHRDLVSQYVTFGGAEFKCYFNIAGMELSRFSVNPDREFIVHSFEYHCDQDFMIGKVNQPLTDKFQTVVNFNIVPLEVISMTAQLLFNTEDESTFAPVRGLLRALCKEIKEIVMIFA
jgi:hypothetical protein